MLLRCGVQVAASHFGAHCFGTDIDIRVLRGDMHAGVRVPTLPPPPPSPPPATGRGQPSTGQQTEQQTEQRSEKQAGQAPSAGPREWVPKQRQKGVCTKKLTGDIPRSIWDNFRAYGLPAPEVLRLDNHLFDRHCRASVVGGLFDAIVTDPPVSAAGELQVQVQVQAVVRWWRGDVVTW